MRPCLLIAMVVFVCFPSFAGDLVGDPEVSGGMSDNLVLTLAFEAKSATNTDHFKVTLKNKSGNDLNVHVDPTNFHGRIVLIHKNKGEKEYYEKRYFKILVTGLFLEPVHNLKKGAILTWEIPVAELRGLYDTQLTVEELNSATAYASLNLIAIIPPDRGYISSNAKQTSAKILINYEKGSGADGGRAIRPETDRTSTAAGNFILCPEFW